MSEGEAQRSWSSNDLAVLVILRAVTRAHELVGSTIPGNDTAEMGTNGVDSEVLELAVLVGDEIVGITLQTLN